MFRVLQYCAAQPAAVVGEVVAAEHRVRCDAALPALRQPGHDVADGAIGCVRRRQVVDDFRMCEVETVAGQAVALLGDRQRDQSHRGIGQPRQYGSAFVACAQQFAD